MGEAERPKGQIDFVLEPEAKILSLLNGFARRDRIENTVILIAISKINTYTDDFVQNT